MDAIQALKSRRSVRQYSDRPVAGELLEQAVDCARMAATARNEQPWEFVAVTSAPKIKELAEITDHGKFLASAPACVAVFCRETKYFLEDGSAATQNLMVAAAALGLGSCWIAGDKKPYAQRIVQALGVPEGFRLVSLVALGHPAAQPHAPQKRGLKELLHWEKF
ncbi:MAG: nitroreductase family protein [Deltaproteobacteria bacterium]